MKFRFIFFISIIIHQIYFITSIEPSTPNGKDMNQFNTVYRIDSKEKGYPLIIQNNGVFFSSKKEGKEESFRIIPTGTNLNSYYIISKPFNKKIGINDKNELILYNINNLEVKDKAEWNFIELNNKQFLLQNSFNKKFLEIKQKNEKKKIILYAVCNSDVDIFDLDKIKNSLKYSFFKLCEEVVLKPEHIEIIEKEPVDVLIKYIDLSDKTLNRKGISQTKKDEDNGELRYSVRSILQYIPWIRKIFILMPNQKVKYFKPIYEIENKIVYVKDKDLLGFDSANSVVFQLHLYNMAKFGLSENFILMDDDCFFGKPIKKTDFFYYDEETKKVVPSLVTDDFTEMIKPDILKEYHKLYAKRKIIKPHSFNGWKITQLSSYKLLLEQFPFPLINAGFNHNAIPLNLNDLKEIYDLIKNKYQHAKDILSSKERSIYDLQPQSLFNSYALNVKKRKVNSIPSVYYDVAFIKDKNLDIEMFVINTSGDRKYTKNQFNLATLMLQNKFSVPTPFETEVDMVNTIDKKKVNIKNYVPKDQYDKIKKDIYNIEKYNKELNKKIEKIIVEKYNVEEYLSNEIKFIFDNIKDIESKEFKYNISSTNSTNDNNEISQKDKLEGFIFLQNLLKIIILFLFVIFLSCFFYLCYFINNKEYPKNTHTKIIKPNSINDNNEDFSQLSSEEKI